MVSEGIIRVKITEKMKEEARLETLEDLKHLPGKLKGNYTFDRKYIGTIGQKCTEAFFKENKIVFEIDSTREPGKPDRFDLKCGSYLIEVKTRSSSQENIIIIPKRQIDRNVFDYYIGVKLDGSLNFVFIQGYAYSGEIRSSLLKQGKFGYWYHFPFERLNPIQDLVTNLPKIN